jgi:uncharacterized protein (DUF2249 family)
VAPGHNNNATLDVLAGPEVSQASRATHRSLSEEPIGSAAPVDVLIEALAELAEAGRTERASRLAAAAYAGLRRSEPEQAQRVNALMHKLILSPRHNHDKEQQMPTSDPDLDVRHEPPARRHELIFETWEALAAGEGFILINDHDPKPLEYQFAAEEAGKFTWDYLEQGPEVWRVRIGRSAKATG